MCELRYGRIFVMGLVLFLTPQGARAQGQARGQVRRTPLGVQTPFPSEQLAELQKQKEKTKAAAAVLEPATQVIERAANAHGGRQKLRAVEDSVSEGTLTRFSSSGVPQAFPLTVMGKGEGKVQRIIRQGGRELRQGSDGGQTWDGIDGHYAPIRGHALSFVETQTVRSVRGLVDFDVRGAHVKDGGVQGGQRAIEIEDESGRATTYFVESSGRVARLEFVTGQGTNPFTGKPVPIVDSYEFSDYRLLQGVLTPMKIEHSTNGLKVDTTEFTSVRYNTAVDNALFRP